MNLFFLKRIKTKNLPAQPTKIGDYMKTEEKYKPDTNQNSEKITLEKTMPRLDDPVIQAYIDAKKQKVYTTEKTEPIKKRDLRYFGRLGARLAEESVESIKKELEEENKNQQTN